MAMATNIRLRSRASGELVFTSKVFMPSTAERVVQCVFHGLRHAAGKLGGLVLGSALLPIAPGLIVGIFCSSFDEILN